MTDKTVRERQERFKERHRSRGNRRVSITVPEQSVGEIHRIAERLRNGSNVGLPDPDDVERLERMLREAQQERDRLAEERDELKRSNDRQADKIANLDRRVSERDDDLREVRGRLDKLQDKYEEARDSAWKHHAAHIAEKEKRQAAEHEARRLKDRLKAADWRTRLARTLLKM